MSNLRGGRPGRRLNRRAATLLGLAVVIAIIGFLGYKSYRERNHGSLYLREARARLEKNQTQLAIQYLNRYLTLHGDDVEALDLKGKVLAEGARNTSQALEAIQVHTQVLGRAPDDPRRQETRRRLIELNLRIGSRARAAEALARELIRRGATDASAHRLLAEALEGVGKEGETKAFEEAAKEYETARALDPGGIPVSERLAALYRNALKRPERGVAVLDELVKSNRGDASRLAATHLCRSRYFAMAGQPDLASTEVRDALKADPKSLDVLLAAAEDANRLGDTALARRHLDAIPKADRGGLRAKLAEGMVELNEQRPDDAIQSWRDGLVQTGGSHADLTWLMARVLLNMGRTREAEPLRAQYRRLVGGEEPDPSYRFLEGLDLLKKDRPAEAIAILEGVRYKAPRSLEPHLYHLLGQCFEQIGDVAKAKAAYREATGADPRWSPPWIELSRIEGTDRLDDARRVLEQGLAVSPEDPQLLVNLALVLLREQARLPKEKRDWGRVEKALAGAERVNPRAAELAQVRADYLTMLGRADDALKSLESATTSNPNAISLWTARINLLSRLGRPKEALAALDRAEANRPQAGFSILRASILVALGHVNEARSTLLESLNRVPIEGRPQIWKALGELARDQGDLAGARQAYGEWIRLQPENAEPRVAILDLALASGDAPETRRAVDSLKGIGGPQSPYWKMGRAEELLQKKSGTTRELEEAESLVREVEANQPQHPGGYVLEGKLAERRGQVDRAIAAYRNAVRRKGSRNALAPLVALLVREHRDLELAELRKSVAEMPRDLERLATVQALKVGDKDRAERLAALMVQGDPQGLDSRVWQARVLNELGKPKEAEATLRHLIDAHPTEAAPGLQLLMFLVSEGRTAEAKETIEQMRSRVKSDRPEVLWAQCYRVVGDLSRANLSYQNALNQWPDDLPVLSSAIAFDQQTGRIEDAERLLRHVVKLDPNLSWATRALALSLAGHEGDRGAWGEALALVGATPKPGETPNDRLARAGVYARGPEPEDRRKAIAILEGLATELPKATTVQEQLARLLRDSGEGERARAVAAKAAGEGASPDAILLYASTLLSQSSLDEAERQVDRLVKLNPDSPAVAEIRARILAVRGKGKDAAAILERAFEAQLKSPRVVVVGEKMIGLLLQLNQPDAAERVARQVGAINPEGSCVLAMFLAGRGKVEEADRLLNDAAKAGASEASGTAALTLAYLPRPDPRWLDLADRELGEALATHPDSIDLLQKQARVRYLQGRYAAQVALYESILKRKPADFAFLNDMAWTLSEDLNRPKEGLERADEAIRKVGRQPNLLDTRGVILLRLGKLDEAIKELETAASSMPVGPVYFHLARAYREGGRDEAFRKAREQARKAGLRPEQLQASERNDWSQVME